MNHILIITDYSTIRDRRIFDNTGERTIFDGWRPGTEIFGWGPWHRIKKHALFPYGKKPNKTEIHRAKERVKELVAAFEGLVVILQTPGASSGEEEQHTSGSLAWSALSPPDTIDNMFGTYWKYGKAAVMACPTLYRRQSQLQRWELGRFLERAKQFEQCLTPDTTAYHPAEETLALLKCMQGYPLSVDLETIPSTQTITAVNLATADGLAISLPWDAYDTPDGTHVRKLPAAHRRMILNLLHADTTKIGHNIAFDKRELMAKGIAMGGALMDTMLLSRTITPELTHGLQKVTARWMACPPWKSTFKPAGLKPGVNKDHPDYWRTDPEALRIYGAQDAWYTARLAYDLAPMIGLNL
jgi:hypothetical protein